MSFQSPINNFVDKLDIIYEEVIYVEIQYPIGKSGGQNDMTCSYLSGSAVNKDDRTCQGIKICEFCKFKTLGNAAQISRF
ncbi:7973_t:CDS:2 [Funneliformis geosporum]|uniref:7973_t:CDS:1 n=1 Tax=Funneliformis geosporum TaxID=1117311 RepID=A0A9W4X2G7_9GLOM|nr:7973_t:CDS:2 [Funneliformis geosporum]